MARDLGGFWARPADRTVKGGGGRVKLRPGAIATAPTLDWVIPHRYALVAFSPLELDKEACDVVQGLAGRGGSWAKLPGAHRSRDEARARLRRPPDGPLRRHRSVRAAGGPVRISLGGARDAD